MNSRADRRPAQQASKPSRARSRKSGFGGTLLGLFIGLALGLGLAAGVAFYLMKGFNPFQSGSNRDSAREPAKEMAKPGRSDSAAPEKPRFDFYKILPGVEEPKIQTKAGERGASDKSTAERAVAPDKADAKAKADARAVAKTDERASGSAASSAAPAATAAAATTATPAETKPKGDRFWLQAGSFASEADAEDLKARLAFAGWQAAVQSATLPDKTVRYRVRLGPYDNTDALQRMKSDLASRGFDVAVIKF